MKRTAIVSAVLLLASALAFAEGSTITLQNQEQAAFWFVVDPEELSDVALSSTDLAQRVEQFFAAQMGDVSFTPLAADSQLTLEGLGQGVHLLVGFFDAEGADSLPVRVLSVQVDEGPGERFYALFSEPALVSVPRGGAMPAELALAEPAETEAVEAETVEAETVEAETVEAETVEAETVEAETVEAETVEAETVEAETVEAETVEAETVEAETAATGQEALITEAEPAELAPIASFSPSYSPVVFTRESRAGFTVLPIAQSLYWDEEGTRLDSLDGTIADGIMRVWLKSATGFSGNVSYFFYLFANRTLGKENATTIELLPLAKEGQGACVLWQKGAGESAKAAVPRLVGSVSAFENDCLLEIDLSSLPAEVAAELGENPSIDLCSCRYDAATGVFEEFYFTTIQLADFGPSTGGSSTR